VCACVYQAFLSWSLRTTGLLLRQNRRMAGTHLVQAPLPPQRIVSLSGVVLRQSFGGGVECLSSHLDVNVYLFLFEGGGGGEGVLLMKVGHTHCPNTHRHTCMYKLTHTVCTVRASSNGCEYHAFVGEGVGARLWRTPSSSSSIAVTDRIGSAKKS
jgi:hypothetical protein